MGGHFIDEHELQRLKHLENLYEKQLLAIEAFKFENQNLSNRLSIAENQNEELITKINELRNMESELKDFKTKFDLKKNQMTPKPATDKDNAAVNTILKWEDD